MAKCEFVHVSTPSTALGEPVQAAEQLDSWIMEEEICFWLLFNWLQSHFQKFLVTDKAAPAQQRVSFPSLLYFTSVILLTWKPE